MPVFMVDVTLTGSCKHNMAVLIQACVSWPIRAAVLGGVHERDRGSNGAFQTDVK